MKSKARVILILQDDPLFLYDDIDYLIRNLNIVGFTVLGQKLPNDSISKLIERYVNIFGCFGFFRLALNVFFNKYIKRRLLVNKFNEWGIANYPTSDLNSSIYINSVKALEPDLLISIACPQKIRDELLAVPKIGSINLHGGYLPDFPGVFTPFWNLLKGSNYAGCTVHWMNCAIDSGDIILRKKFHIDGSMSILDIYSEISKIGIPLVVEAIDLLERKQINLIPNQSAEGCYNTFPTRRDGKLFRAKGFKAI